MIFWCSWKWKKKFTCKLGVSGVNELMNFWCRLVTGDKFLCRSVVFTAAGANRGGGTVYDLCYLLSDSCFLCKEQCLGNKGKITPRNWNCASSSGIEVLYPPHSPAFPRCFTSCIINTKSEMITYRGSLFWLILTLSIQIADRLGTFYTCVPPTSVLSKFSSFPIHAGAGHYLETGMLTPEVPCIFVLTTFSYQIGCSLHIVKNR